MGANQSAVANYNSKPKKYTENEIKENINRLFLNNKHNDINETSVGTLGNFNELSFDPNPISKPSNYDNYSPINVSQLGGNIKPRRNRYQKYELEPFISKLTQKGGNIQNQPQPDDTDSYKAISDLSEFKRLRDYLKNDSCSNIAKNTTKVQNGGYDNFSLNYSFDTPASIPQKQFNIFDILKGGSKKIKEFDDDLSEDDFSLDSDELSSTSYSAEGILGKKSKGKKKKSKHDRDQAKEMPKEEEEEEEEKKKEDIDEEEEEEEEEEVMPEEEEEEEEEAEEFGFDSEKINSFSETSLSSRSSDINILPFYSTSDSSNYSFKHPYVKNRF